MDKKEVPKGKHKKFAELSDAAHTVVFRVISGTVGIDKSQVDAKISLYPNPVSEVLHISSNARIEAIEIMNSVGAMLIRRSKVNAGIDVSDLQPGLYFVKVSLFFLLQVYLNFLVLFHLFFFYSIYLLDPQIEIH